MKSILNLLKRISSEQNWNDAITAVMISEQLPNVLFKIYTDKAFLAAPHLVLFAVEIITTFIYAFPSNISALQVILFHGYKQNHQGKMKGHF